jgi:hypothetical protein
MSSIAISLIFCMRETRVANEIERSQIPEYVAARHFSLSEESHHKGETTMLKTIMLNGILLAMAMVAAPAYSYVTASQLQTPASLPKSQQHACVAVSFSADDTVHGFCYTLSWGGCSGRGCQPPSTYEFYDTKWNTDTTAASAVFCGKWVSHYSLSQWTYAPGYDATTCYKAPFPGTGPTQIVLINGVTQYAHYVSASTDGVYGLWDAFGTSWIGEF